ncbi:MAG: hypothetical protein LBR09_00905 [Endomicrobium sp.]|jgi:hypothetical protein|nr:hypothetical protein [Endomicrobium sp.]
MLLALLCILGIIISTSASFTEEPGPTVLPVKLSLWDKVAIPEGDLVHGVELGIGSYTPQLKGYALNLIFTKTDNASGIHKGFITVTKLFSGIQLGVINLNFKKIYGAQFGFFNKAKSIEGIQIGVVNMTDNMHGMQIGLLNFIGRGYFRTMVLFNAKF